MNLMGYDAMAIGDLDLQLGPDVLRQRITEAEFPVLSANVMVTAEQKLLTQPYALLETGGRKVGIIGLTWDSAATAQAHYVLLKADDVLPEYVAELAKQTDIIIVLSNMGHEEDMRLSSLVPGIDLIIGGRTYMSESWRNEQTGTRVVQAGSQGQRVGRRHLRLDSAGLVTEYSDELLLLTEEYADDPQMSALLDSYRAQ
jgi:2',3'-cyclic-nucleotide 2'-phosphodiesterase (5'-nucleotidase family)